MASHLPLILSSLLFFSIGLGGALLFQDNNPTATTSPVEDSGDRRRTIHHRDSLSSLDFKNIDKVFELIPALETSEECRRLARNLNADPDNRHNKTLWALLLARWSEIAPEEMIAFLESEKKSGHPTNMEELAWEAWGISSPETAAHHLGSISYENQRSLMKGITQKDPSLALKIAKSSPNTPRLISTILFNASEIDIETFEELQKTASSGGTSFSFPAKHIAKMAQDDPQAALRFAQGEGRRFNNVSSSLIGEIALQAPDIAIEHLASQPSSRLKSLATVEVAKKIAYKDPAQSLTFARSLKPGLTRDVSLLAVASVIGGEDPLKGLALIEEANWNTLTSLYKINTGKAHNPTHLTTNGNIETPVLAARLLSSLAVTDADQAENYLNTVVPENQREEIRKLLSEK